MRICALTRIPELLYQGLNDKAGNLYTQAASATAYLVPEILSIEEDKLQQFILEKKN